MSVSFEVYRSQSWVTLNVFLSSILLCYYKTVLICISTDFKLIPVGNKTLKRVLLSFVAILFELSEKHLPMESVPLIGWLFG